MNANELKAELARAGFSIPQIADKIGISKKAFYCKLEGTSEFKQNEIKELKRLLSLSDSRVSEIFFAE
ncbi:MAG: toxin-antitoxin system, antitoxin component, Xre family protein [[Eubacterium] saphenum]|nr:toxin-antitoxin system, antitoxin component, Xre family protein [[Eubacterium] saphenum]